MNDLSFNIFVDITVPANFQKNSNFLRKYEMRISSGNWAKRINGWQILYEYSVMFSTVYKVIITCHRKVLKKYASKLSFVFISYFVVWILKLYNNTLEYFSPIDFWRLHQIQWHLNIWIFLTGKHMPLIICPTAQFTIRSHDLRIVQYADIKQRTCWHTKCAYLVSFIRKSRRFATVTRAYAQTRHSRQIIDQN